MKFKYIFIWVLVIKCLSYSALYAQENLPKDKPGTAVFVMSKEKNNLINVTTDTIQSETDCYQVNLKIPVLDGLKSKSLQNKINKKNRKEQLGLKASIESDAKRNLICQTEKGYPFIPYELMSNYHVKANHEIFSLEITIYDYRGGAHGMTTRTYYNIDTTKGKLLSLNDYLEKCAGDIDGRTILNAEINKQINERKKQGEAFFEEGQGFNGIKENQSFYITNDHQLVIVFGLYEIAPYAAGIIEFAIPKEIISCYD